MEFHENEIKGNVPVRELSANMEIANNIKGGSLLVFSFISEIFSDKIKYAFTKKICPKTRPINFQYSMW